VPFNAEADSLNCAILGPDVTPDSEEFDLFVKEVAREMTTKAGQKCTAIRRAIVPAKHIDAVATRLRERLAKSWSAIRRWKACAWAPWLPTSSSAMSVSACAAAGQLRPAVRRQRWLRPGGEGVAEGAFFAPTLLLARDPHAEGGAHDIEAFGPVSTLMAYDDLDEALALAARGKGSLVATLVTADRSVAAKAIPAAAAWHGRLLVLDSEAAKESTGHGSPLPQLKHGGPGRAGGGEELGGLRAVKHYLQRAAVQGSPSMLAAVTGEYVRGAEVIETEVHPFRRYFETCASASRC
jgi:oxepin-CoA hydrolase/3-oxo-5,6-dehydrosuberyl-CoA semialdehyde dehydrogenase